jgi:hypothetical protein
VLKKKKKKKKKRGEEERGRSKHTLSCDLSWVPVAHPYNPSYSGGRD